MDIGGPAWSEAQRAWRRLLKRAAETTSRDGGEHALHALSDISMVRRLLDQAELSAVRTARRHAKSWAEIATNLGVTRQSAWERWRELDDTGPVGGASEASAMAHPEAQARAVAAASMEQVEARTKPVTVPDVIGLTVDEARRVLTEAGFIAAAHIPGAAPDPDLPPDGTVVDQVPEAGARRRPGSSITLWIERGDGSAGVREPRRPGPSPREAFAENDPTG